MTQLFKSKVLDLAKQKGFYPYKYMINFEKFKEELPGKKETFYSLFKGIKTSDKLYVDVLKVMDRF